jgi:hypothetical protein
MIDGMYLQQEADMTPSIIFESNNGRIVIMDSIARISDENEGDIIVCGSHGGRSAAEHAVKFKPKGVILNDAGRGKENAGMAGLEILDNDGIMAATVDAMSAKIGEGLDSYNSGIISAVNERARQGGVKIGISAREAALKMLTETKKGQ